LVVDSTFERVFDKLYSTPNLRQLFIQIFVKLIMQQETTKTRYNDTELNEFRILIKEKIGIAREELNELAGTLSASNTNGDDAAIAGKTLEDGSATFEKEQINQLAARQKKFIEQLEAALMRIENRTYGICRSTGKLIPKERLLAVPHTTQSMEAKLKQA
jgi:RNA polymerase-binding transcription factor DksA